MLQPVLMINGYLISIMGLAMLIPAAIDMYYSRTHWSAFLTSSVILVFIGVSLYLSNRTKIKKITIQQGYLLTVTSWFALTFLATLPFILTGAIPNFADALFESASGISSTGATIMSGLDHTPHSILMWRSVLSGLGGVGIVIFAVALLPFLGIGGMQIFTRENSDMNDKILPKFSSIAKEIIIIYITLCILCCLSLAHAGMGWFDALNHALSSVSTGGFSTHDASVGYFNSPLIEAILMVFMILGALPMTLYILLAQHKAINNIRYNQAASFLKVLFAYISFMSLWLFFTSDYNLLQAIRYTSFNIISVVTTTGLVSTDYLAWGSFAAVMFFFFSFTGGCTGSTSGSIKIFRWQVVVAFLKRSLIVSVDPQRVTPTKVGTMILSNNIIISVFAFLAAYVFAIVILTIFVSLTGLDFETSISAVVACVTNVGPGVSNIIGPSGNYSSLSDTAKYILAFAMILGRLEILTVLVVFTRNFWRR